MQRLYITTSMTLEELRAHDPEDMYSAIAGFPEQILKGVEIGRSAPSLIKAKARRIVILGMGGSAIGGDLLRSYIRSFPQSDVDIQIVRGYQPPYIDAKTLLIAASYSGGTEETLTAYEAARAKAGQVLAVTTGGELGRLASLFDHKQIVLPGGLQPRAALAYSFFPLLYCLAVKNRLFGDEIAEETRVGIIETVELLRKLTRKYSAGPARGNSAFSLAEKINGKIPVIYSSSDRLDTVNVRWRGQVQENAKHLAFGNLLPEMNHNEINGWQHPEGASKGLFAIFLRDRDDHERVSKRIDITRKIIARRAGGSLEAVSQGESLLARIFSLINLGDWVSYYLATLNGTDPTPVTVIENLKRQLAKT